MNESESNRSRFVDDQDARVRRQMLQSCISGVKYVTEPKKSLVHVQTYIVSAASDVTDVTQFHHLLESTKGCSELIEIVKSPELPRGPVEFGKALKLISHLVNSGLFFASSTSACSLPPAELGNSTPSAIEPEYQI